ncbi:MAG: lmo0937 family membrane protein [Planctomycetes bacterium]|nr:lmo0937 family membrane protein [Planctomycetota bacterium]
MLWTICVILLILWALGLITGTSVGGFVHVLLILAIVVVIVELVRPSRRRGG